MSTSGVKTGKYCAYAGTSKKSRRLFARCVFGGEMSAWQKCLIKFMLGGIGYGLIELIWRGRTHISMVITGGACFIAIFAVNEKMKGKRIFFRSAACAVAITAVELAVGLVVNRWFNMNVWDYSGIPGNVMGQICPLYSFLWFLLCLPICFTVERMGKKRIKKV